MDILQFEDSEFSNFQITSLKILARLTTSGYIDDEIIDHLRDLEMEYDVLTKKYALLEETSNLDCKTSLLKYNEDFLVNIVKTISRYWHAKQKPHILPVSYIRLDLDDFSKINNRYGHDIGDVVLISIADTLKKSVRPTDYIFRFGGEEFDIVLPVTPVEGAYVYVEKALDLIRELNIPVEGEGTIKVTASMGVSHFEIDLSVVNKEVVSSDILCLYRKAQKEADNACYDAKYKGKNRYCVYNNQTDYKNIMQKYSTGEFIAPPSPIF